MEFMGIDFSAIFTNLANQFVQGLMAMIIVVVFLLVGLIVAYILKIIITRILEAVQFEEALGQLQLQKALHGVTPTRLITILVKVYVLLAFLGAAASYINVQFLANIIYQIVLYIPLFVQGALIVLGAIVVTYYASMAIKKTNVFLAHQLALIVKMLVVYLAVIIALPLFLPGVDVTSLMTILELLITAVVIAIGLGFGLALGLGLKDPISKAGLKNQALFDSMFEKITRRR